MLHRLHVNLDVSIAEVVPCDAYSIPETMAMNSTYQREQESQVQQSREEEEVEVRKHASRKARRSWIEKPASLGVQCSRIQESVKSEEGESDVKQF